MTNIRPIWSPQDSVDTAQQFHLELHNAERGRVERRLFSVSRERKARRMDALAVALLMIVMAAFGVIVMLLSTPQAKADPDSMVYAYAATFGSAVCDAPLFARRPEPTIRELDHLAERVLRKVRNREGVVRSFAASSAGSHA
mgnify:CR=1 FL=1